MQFHCLFDGSKTQTDCRMVLEGNVALLDLKMKPSIKSTELLVNRLRSAHFYFYILTTLESRLAMLQAAAM